MSVTFREYRVVSFGYYKDHYCIDKDGELLYDCHDENIGRQLFNYLKKLWKATIEDVELFFRFLYENSEHYQFYYKDHRDLMQRYSNEKLNRG